MTEVENKAMACLVTSELKERLQYLANKYEVPSFCDADPIQFVRWYPQSQTSNVECAAFIAAMLAFGSRKQFIPKIKEILTLADTTLDAEGNSLGAAKWCMSGAPGFPQGSKKFYRFYSYDDLHTFFAELGELFRNNNTLGEYFQNKGKAFPCPQPQSSATPSSGLSRRPQLPLTLAEEISLAFPKSAIVPKGKNTANKRIHMLLRWLVRQNSSVDIGIWNWADQSKLLIPLDVHVLQEGINLNLLPENAGATRKTAEKLTAIMEEVFPGDPARGDFALFGLGVDETLV